MMVPRTRGQGLSQSGRVTVPLRLAFPFLYRARGIVVVGARVSAPR